MFPEDLRPWYFQSLNGPLTSFAGTASIRLGAAPSLRYEFTSAPDLTVLPIDQDVLLEDQVARLLGFEGVTIRAGNYEINRRIGKYGGIDFVVAVSGLSQDKIGAMHNRSLVYLYRDADFLGIVRGRNGRPFTLSEISNILAVLKKFLLSEGLSASEIDRANEHALKVIEDLGVLESSAATDPRTLALAEAKGYLPREVAIEWTTVLQRSADGESLDGILRYVNDQIRPRLQSTCNGRYAEVFRDVSRNSSQYWGPRQLKPGTGVILADGVGALYGLLLGPLAPVASIVEGTLFSILANESI